MRSKRASDGAGLPLTTNEREQPPVSSSPTEPISAQQPPSPPSTQGSVQSLPFHVAIADGGLEIEAKIRKGKDLDNLIRVLQTIKPLLPNIYGQQPSAVADPPDPPDVGEHRQHAFDDSMTPQKQAETGVSFFITKTQKGELRRLGYSEEQIREMKPEDAHRALGLIS